MEEIKDISNRKSLSEIYKNYMGPDGHGDKGTAHSYIERYEEMLLPYRNDDVCLMEIGVAHGDSIVMWSDYFSDESNIIGVDIQFNELLSHHHRDNITYIKSDATNKDVLNKIKEYEFDIIIDDGSHKLEHQIKSFLLLKDKMKDGGIYIIEDVVSLDEVKDKFIELHDNCEIMDLREKKGRYDDVLIIYRF